MNHSIDLLPHRSRLSGYRPVSVFVSEGMKTVWRGRMQTTVGGWRLSRNDSIGSVVLAASSSARVSLFTRYGPSIGPCLALASSCERIRDAIPFLPTESFRLSNVDHPLAPLATASRVPMPQSQQQFFGYLPVHPLPTSQSHRVSKVLRQQVLSKKAENGLPGRGFRPMKRADF